MHQSAHFLARTKRKEHTQIKKELSNPIVEEQTLRKAAHVLCNAALSLTSAVTLPTVAKTHSTVKSKDHQGPERTHRPLLP